MTELLKRPFKRRELVLLLVLIILFLGLFYYNFVKLPVERRIRAADTTEIENSILSEQQKQQRIRSMQKEMESSLSEGGSYVPTYNNFNEEANLLNEIFGSAKSYHFTFHEPEAEDDVVRRQIDIDFTVGSYAEAHSMLLQLKDSQYRLIMGDLSLTAGGSTSVEGRLPGLKDSGELSGSVSITFFETLYDAQTTDGLQMKESAGSSTSTEGSSNALADAAESWATDVVNGNS